MTDTLTHLLVMAGIPRWHQHHVFGNARLVGSSLFVPDKELAALIARCYLADLSREYGKPLTLTIGQSPEPSIKPQAPGSAFKKAYRGQIEKMHQGDML